MMQMVSLVHQIAKGCLTKGSRAVDATMGNGGDTEFLCGLVGETGKVYAFDIQKEAVGHTRKRLEAAGYGERAELFCCSHAQAAGKIDEEIDLFVFNLGYLPGGDKRIITRKESTLAAVDGLLGKLKSKGTGLILSYYGHVGGMEEKNGLEAYLKQLPGKSYDVLQIGMVNRDHFPPVLYVVKKLT